MNRVGDAVFCGFEAFCSRDWGDREVDAQRIANNLVSWYATTIGPLRFVWLYADERILAGQILAGMIRAHVFMLKGNLLRAGVLGSVVVEECGITRQPSLMVRECITPNGDAVPDGLLSPLPPRPRPSHGGDS